MEPDQPAMMLLALLLAAGLALVHVVAGRVQMQDRETHGRWLSFGGGVSVAYVFMHLLPELAAGQSEVDPPEWLSMVGPGSLTWAVALAGLSTFYGLERLAVRSRERNRGERGEGADDHTDDGADEGGGQAEGDDGEGDGQDDHTEAHVFRLHIASFAVYNVVIGYLLQYQSERGVAWLLTFWLAMLLHFFVNDSVMREHHCARYRRQGRWILAAAVLAGGASGMVVQLSQGVLTLLLAFLGGGIVLNVLKEELPEERESCFTAFVAGAGLYAVLLFALG